ncbi:hypothetical protein MMOR_00130 [Mycolicibacterium moriokaense]|uniref:Uncharacterized protein n=1 Tax=Mycolicibacterium moriokaense TaxID=39691 RepID=A0AAD1H530_9MYCO|nr:hypothetical protein MMOR_00130 [Mycolicibacterium moriokaense]
MLTNQRVLATLSTVPKLAGRTIDQRWDAEQSGAATADLAESGLHIEVNINAVDTRFDGQLSLQYKTAIPSEVLTRATGRLPSMSRPVCVPRGRVPYDGPRYAYFYLERVSSARNRSSTRSVEEPPTRDMLLAMSQKVAGCAPCLFRGSTMRKDPE